MEIHVIMTKAAIIRYSYEYGRKLSVGEIRKITDELLYFCRSWGDRDGAFMDYLGRKRMKVPLNNETTLRVIPLQRDDIIVVAIHGIMHPHVATKQAAARSAEIVPDYWLK